MRVLALVTDGFGGSGGIAQYNQDFLRALSVGKDASVDHLLVLPRNRPEKQVILPDNTIQLQAPFCRFCYIFKVLEIVFRQGPFDLVFCGHLNLIVLARIASLLGKASLWLQLHGIEAWSRPGVLRRRGAEAADLVTTVSRYTRKMFLTWAACVPYKVRVLPNTVDERFYPGPARTDLMEKYSLKGKKVLLTVGRLSASERYKGHDRVIDIMPELLRQVPSLVYLVAGDGDDRLRLESMVQNLHLEEHVIFLGKVEQEELSDIYRLADVYVMPSTGEGFGIVFLEAAASGLPVVGGNCDGSVDALADGLIGTAVDPDNRELLIKAILNSMKGKTYPNQEQLARFNRVNFDSRVAKLTAAIGEQ